MATARKASKAEKAGAYVALLRGINVGGKNKLPMKQLVAMFERAGCASVSHYIQSGNVVFAATPELAGRIPAIIANDIKSELGITVPVVVRSEAALRAAMAENPQLKSGADPEQLHVMFLADAPSAKAAAALDPNRSPGDSFVVKGTEVFLHLPNGAARTRITNAWIDSALQTTSTQRNWRTVQRLVEMAAALDNPR